MFSYSDLSHDEVMHKASRALAAGADFRLLGPNLTMLQASRPVVAVCAVRTGSGKSQTSRRVGRILLDAGLRVVLVRHPMPYGDLERMRVQRFETLADIDAARPTIEEREEYEAPVRAGMVVYAGVDYAEILARAEAEADVLVWDGGNNDLPFFRPDLHYPHIGSGLPAMGYSAEQLDELERTIDAAECDVVVTGTPIDLEHVIRTRHPIRRAGYELEEVATPTLEELLAPIVGRATTEAPAAA